MGREGLPNLPLGVLALARDDLVSTIAVSVLDFLLLPLFLSVSTRSLFELRVRMEIEIGREWIVLILLIAYLKEKRLKHCTMECMLVGCK